MNRKIEIQIENLAIAVSNGFKEIREEMDKRFTQVDMRFEEVDRRFDRVEMILLGHTNRIEVLEDKVRLISTKIGL